MLTAHNAYGETTAPGDTTRPNDETTRSNAEVDWDAFDSRSYSNHNYRTLRDDDQQIVQIVRDFFGGLDLRGLKGLDIGSGANLYPALTMLPMCTSIDLWEYSSSNVRWLERQIESPEGRRWDRFWSLLAEHKSYAGLPDFRPALHETARVTQASIFDLPARQWSIGTMFFVACSLSEDMNEFERAVRSFVGSLDEHAPFAAAFMIGSTGYRVNRSWFPAVRINRADVERVLASIAYDMTVHTITTRTPLRPDYGGMLLVTGRSAP